MIIRPTLWQIPQPDSTVRNNLKAKSEILSNRLTEIVTRHNCVRFASSLAVEDLVITDAIVKSGANISIFTLETGKLNPETLA